MIRWNVGDLQLTLLDAGRLWLDGGAMFGVVPKPLWSRERIPDERNRIELAMNLLLVDDGKSKTLIDTGAGSGWSEKERDIFSLENTSAEQLLAPAGVAPDQIDRVVNTHLHFDHAGGNTMEVAEGGGSVAAFPRAEYFAQRVELETARRQNERIRASYRPQYYEPLAEAGRLHLLDGATRVGPVSVEPAPGHTPGMQIVLVEAGNETVAFMADLVPTASHLRYPYIMGYDLEPMVTLESKKRILPRAASENWCVVFEHDAEMPLARLAFESGRITAHALDPQEV